MHVVQGGLHTGTKPDDSVVKAASRERLLMNGSVHGGGLWLTSPHSSSRSRHRASRAPRLDVGGIVMGPSSHRAMGSDAPGLARHYLFSEARVLLAGPEALPRKPLQHLVLVLPEMPAEGLPGLAKRLTWALGRLGIVTDAPPSFGSSVEASAFVARAMVGALCARVISVDGVLVDARVAEHNVPLVLRTLREAFDSKSTWAAGEQIADLVAAMFGATAGGHAKVEEARPMSSPLGAASWTTTLAKDTRSKPARSSGADGAPCEKRPSPTKMSLDSDKRPPPTKMSLDSDKRPSPTEMSLDESCLRAFQSELTYIYRTLSRLGMQSSERDDLAQDIFLALRTSWHTYDQSRPIRPYIFGIAHNLIAKYRRKRKRDFDGNAFPPPEEIRPPDELMQAREARQMVLAALEKIPSPRRAMLAMHEIEEMPVAEIAAKMSIPLFTVYSRLRIGRKELSAALRSSAMDRGLK